MNASPARSMRSIARTARAVAMRSSCPPPRYRQLTILTSPASLLSLTGSATSMVLEMPSRPRLRQPGFGRAAVRRQLTLGLQHVSSHDRIAEARHEVRLLDNLAGSVRVA